MNFLEQIVSEWFEYSGYLISRNIRFGRLVRGSYTGEIDIAAFNPHTNTLIHIETSGDANSSAVRTNKIRSKFRNANNYYQSLFPYSTSVRQIVIINYSRRPRNVMNYGGNVVICTIPMFMNSICSHLRSLNPISAAISESYPLLRAIQFALFYS